MITPYVRLCVLQQVSQLYYQNARKNYRQFTYAANKAAEYSKSARDTLFHCIKHKVDLTADPNQVFHCVRVYTDGSAKETFRDADGAISWITYNAIFRPGNTLFVDNLLVEDFTGYLDYETISEIIPYMSSSKKPALQQRMTHGFGEPTRVRYPDDTNVYPDFHSIIDKSRLRKFTKQEAV
jgi:hypothetical protein